MLLNATQPDKLRVAVIDDRTVVDTVLEAPGPHQCKANIYNGVITRVDLSLQCCFVNFGGDRDGLLPLDAIAPGQLRDVAKRRAVASEDGPCAGQEIMVQVVEDDQGDGALLSAFVSLTGRHLKLIVHAADGSADSSPALCDTLGKLQAPPGMALALRNGTTGYTADALAWDLHFLTRMWLAIDAACKSAHGAFMIYQEAAPVIRAIREHFHPDIGEILVDSGETHGQLYQYMVHVFPDMAPRVKHYQEREPLFSRFGLEQQAGLPRAGIVPLSSGNAWRNGNLTTPDPETSGSPRPRPAALKWLGQLAAKLRGT